MRSRVAGLVASLIAILALAGAAQSDRSAMFTVVEGAVRAGGASARTMMVLKPGVVVLVPKGARATVTFFSDGHRENLSGPCSVRIEVSGARLLTGASSQLRRSGAASQTVLAPTGQNLRRIGGGLQAAADPASDEHAALLAMAEPLTTRNDVLARPSGGGGAPAAPAAPPPLVLTAQTVFARPPVLAWDAEGRSCRVTVRQGVTVAWEAKAASPPVTLPQSLVPGRYEWTVETVGAERAGAFEILPRSERQRVEAAFQEAAAMARTGDPSGWILLMTVLADSGLLAEALAANDAALELRSRDSSLHLARASLLRRLALREEAAHAVREGRGLGAP